MVYIHDKTRDGRRKLKEGPKAQEAYVESLQKEWIDDHASKREPEKEYHPDIIVLDVMLPDINGKEVCQRVRRDSNLDDVKIICISGMVESDKIGELKQAGADDFLQKPFEVETLIDRMCSLLIP